MDPDRFASFGSILRSFRFSRPALSAHQTIPNQARLKLPTGLGTPQVVPCNRIRKRKRVCQIISTRFEPKCQRNPSLPQCSQMLTANGAHEGVLKLWMSNTNTRDVLSSIIHSRVTAIPPESSDSIHFWILTEGHPEATPKLIINHSTGSLQTLGLEKCSSAKLFDKCYAQLAARDDAKKSPGMGVHSKTQKDPAQIEARTWHWQHQN